MSIEIAPPYASPLDQVQLRFLGPDDIEEFQILCREWFPIEYPNGWYKEVTSGQQFFSLAATLNNAIVGVVVADIKDRRKCNKEDSNILGYWYSTDVKVAYILILGVKKQYRRLGIASLLLDNFLSQLKTDENKHCKAVYLHVLPTNSVAISFYEKRHFRFHRLLWNYYNINDRKQNGYCYVMYLNGGEPPWTVLDFFKNVSSCLCGRTTLLAPFKLILRFCFVPCFFIRSYSKRVRIL